MAVHEASQPYQPPIAHPLRAMGTHTFDLDRQVAVVAIIDCTPDSPSEAGRTVGLDVAVRASIDAVAAGADWVDLGGASVAAGEDTAAHEAERVVAIVRELRAASDVVIAVDASDAGVASAAIDAGADVIRVGGAQGPDLIGAIAASDATLVLAHSLDAEVDASTAEAAVEDDVVALLEARVAQALDGGVRADRILLDPGLDLDGHAIDSLRLARRLSTVADLGFPVLATMSSAPLLGAAADASSSERGDRALAATVFAITRGARIVRTHDAARTQVVVRATEALMGWRAPADPIRDLSAFDV
ncbi:MULTISPECIES: dihydropteroate synthase [unclassified Agrococcus]|uniref:dihydropteroate synthase n=1 Tax=unclassified Agrococcus TaxID=2615065 RepID=UPI003613F457